MSITSAHKVSKTEYAITQELFCLINRLDASVNLSLMERVEILDSIQRLLTVLTAAYAIRALELSCTHPDLFTSLK